jgi:hypothetical protein
MKPNFMKIAGIVLPIVGAGLSLATNWLDDKKLDEKVTEKVAKALSEGAKES